MKKHFSPLLFLVLMLLGTGFRSDNPEQRLVRKWKFDEEASRANWEKIFQASKDPEANEFAKGISEYMFAKLAHTISEYRKDGTLLTITTDEETNETKTTKGSWKFDKQNEELIVVENLARKAEDKIKIHSISSTKMEWALPGMTKTEPWILVFVPAE